MKPISARRSRELRLRAEVYGPVVERDNATCALCGRSAGAVHEIAARGVFGHKTMDKCFQLKNMVCLCTACHSKVANPIGRALLLKILAERYGYAYDDEPWSRYLDNPY